MSEKLKVDKERLDKLKEDIHLYNPAKDEIPSCIQVLKPSSAKDTAMVKNFSKICNEVRSKFDSNTQRSFIQLEEKGVTGSGTEVGKIWHRHLKNAIDNPGRDLSSQNDKAANAVINQLKSETIVKGIEFLQTEFRLYGFMQDKESSEIFLWNGNADAIGWLNGNYVIVEWKAVDLLNFWEKNKDAYNKYVHQCLIYGKLLKLHLKLSKLPEILIVPISNQSGKDIHPTIFHEFPQECTKRLDDFIWSVKMPNINKMINKILVNDEVVNDEVVNANPPKENLDDLKIRKLFKDKDTTMRELLDELGLQFFSLKIKE